jgi:hypothetical protein
MDEKRNEGLAVASLVLGILSFIMLGLLSAIPAVICGHMAKGRIRANPAELKGDGLATGGLVLGYLNIALLPVFIVLTGMLAAVAVPLLSANQGRAVEAACRANLIGIEVVKMEYELEYDLPEGTIVRLEDLVGEDEMNLFVCPGAGVYSINPLGESPVCSIHGACDEGKLQE